MLADAQAAEEEFGAMLDVFWAFLLVPLGLGLIGFLEPCSIGASMLFVKSVERNPPAIKLLQAAVFTATRAVFIGLLGALAAIVGTAFLQFQRVSYVLLGALYVVLGLIYLLGYAGRLSARIGPKLATLSTVRGSIVLGLFFGLNVPACSLPILAALLGSAAVVGAAKISQGFAMLALFGFGLSLPLLLALVFTPAQRGLERLLRYSQSVPIIIGALFVLLGTWSMWFGISAPWIRAYL